MQTLDFKILKIGDQIVEHTKFNRRDIVSFLSACIRFFTDSYWNHQLWVGGKYQNGTPIIYEAIAKGVVQIPHDKLEKRLMGADICVLTPVQKLSLAQKALIIETSEQVNGVKYWFLGTLFYQLLHLITGIWFGRKDTDIKSAKYCSHVGMFVYNIVTGYCRKSWKQTPKMTRKENCFHPVWSGKVLFIKNDYDSVSNKK